MAELKAFRRGFGLLLGPLMTLALLAWPTTWAAEGPPDPFDQALTEGRDQDADQWAQRRLSEVMPNPDFRSPDVVSRVLQASRNAQIWARWAQSDQLLAVVAKGLMELGVPESDPVWLDLHVRQIELWTEMARYPEAEQAYANARRKVAQHGLERHPSFDALLAVHADALRAQRRWWEAMVVLEERLSLLQRLDASHHLAQGEVLTALGEMNLAAERLEESNRRFTQAQPELEQAARSARHDPADVLQAKVHWAFSAYRLEQPRWPHCELREALIRTLERQRGRSSPLLVSPLTGAAAYCEDELGDTQAAAMYQRALKIARQTWGDAHPRTLDALNMQGVFMASREYSERVAEQGRRVLDEEQALRRRAHADAPLVNTIGDLVRMSEEPPESCTHFATGQCRADLLALLQALAAGWGEDHPALLILRAHMATRLGGFSSSDASDEDNSARRAFVTGQCEMAFQTAVKMDRGTGPQSAPIAKACADLAWSHRNFQDVVRYLDHAVPLYDRWYGGAEWVSKETAELLETARKVLATR